MDRSFTEIDQKHSMITILICFLIAVIEGIDIQAAGVAASGVKAHFALSASELGLFFSAGILGLLPGALVGGRYADQIGRKKVLIWSVTIFAVFTLCTSWVSSFYSLLLVRFLAGAGLGAAMPNLIALASESTTPEKRGRAVGLMYCGMPIGAILVSLLAAYDMSGNWKTIFYVGGIVPLIVVPLMIKFLPESREFLRAQDAVKSSDQKKLSYKDLFSREYAPRTILLWVSYFFTLMVVYIMLSWLPSLFMELGFSRKDGSMAMVFFQIGAAIGTVVLGMLIDRYKKAYVIILMYIGILLGLFSLNSASTLNLMFVAAAIMGTFTIGGQGVLYAFGSFVYPTHLRGQGVGAASAVGRIGAMMGPAIAGQLLAMGSGATGVISAAIPCIVISAVIMVLLARRLENA
ncbi:3-(3-hydroxy-phenyl)propionate transporter MhpT [Acinetobacter gerneri]|uniref:3-(3-hydroxy-phenyl)propionate transporter MhpT n=1 Tax=Acinetobacter gerneri TaxID=202952 RepID=A0AAW8JL05_9GAMM|nr:3-(3-hydroxy-phenyl)propionate transporter MhpT [Acinetobacter gerneri]MDQ9011727.1 3-(3-hydroxy-phenyl)propionate transporter MhpT [Acinetobacter gerneri]MDQ9015832.1 3-(3-hydroxy-phenyl)propionate transporter MhpT [Acinetobacter gerneri]MDQ9027003.1 3-(3-hydroxy-phenyl)propionate transporter MhpT [Acinetobacter gerneri]MDQ9054286.1 3-(3-hydroxy-phenyl)propionate transporter MhpT [Acinetobacter gerneri]MDQ9061954.1 3-(3-hydroxy-phenyl)propionate transporter MhpT [Acinetobacter gerneri]